ncbi:hypothetical protein YTPLAS18_24580 [Nitrospira sp.]|nr:hypothetical protein YTPLAS18_24580 [Nitrospira sp.]
MLSLFRSSAVGWVGWLAVAIGAGIVAGGLSSAWADTRLFPIVSVSETYDTNVFYAPKSILAPGITPEDFVTFVNPQLILVHSNPSLSGSLSVGGVVGKYINNPDLDFAGFNAATTLNITQMAKRISKRITSLSVLGTYQFTPSASAFGGGGVGFGGVGFGTAGSIGTGAIGPFDSGLVSNRARVTSYSGSVNGSYALTQLTSLSFGYSYNHITFGGQFGLESSAVQNQLFDTTGHTVTAGLNRQMSLNDTLSLNYAYSTFDQSTSGTFTTHTTTGTWSHLWTRELASTVGGGATVLEPYENMNSGVSQSVPLQIQPSVTAVLTWSSASSALRGVGESAGAFGGRMVASPMLMSSMGARSGSIGGLPGQAGSIAAGTILGRGRYILALSYNYGIFPSYVAESGPIQTHVFGAQGSFGLTDRITGQLGVNFARSIGDLGGSQSSVFATDTYGTTAGLNYLVTPNLQASLTHSWLNFVDSSPNPSTVNDGNGAYQFSKQMVMLSLSYVFTATQGFFRSGGLSSGPSSGTSGSSGSTLPGSGGSPSGGSPEKGLK